ncbi:unnamed protein product [Closterium sp. NIES-53]
MRGPAPMKQRKPAHFLCSCMDLTICLSALLCFSHPPTQCVLSSPLTPTQPFALSSSPPSPFLRSLLAASPVRSEPARQSLALAALLPSQRRQHRRMQLRVARRHHVAHPVLRAQRRQPQLAPAPVAHAPARARHNGDEREVVPGLHAELERHVHEPARSPTTARPSTCTASSSRTSGP